MPPVRPTMPTPTGRPPQALALAALLVMGTAAHAGVTPLQMEMSAVSSSCITNCLVAANHTVDTDSPAPLVGSFGDLSVATHTDAVFNAFPTEASGSTTVTGDGTFTVHHLVNRPTRPAQSTGQYETSVMTRFVFVTGAEGGLMTVQYSATYARPISGAWLHTGLGIGAPRNQPGMSVAPLDFNSLGGTTGGVWQFDLLPEQYYDLTLATSHDTAFSSGPFPFETDRIDVTYLVTMPSFAQAVPEPATWALWAGGVLGLGALARRRQPGGLPRV